MHLSYTHQKLNNLARELFLEHDWRMPRGFMQHDLADPRNYTLAEWQQAKRAKHDPKVLKTMFQDCWATTDCQAAFASSLREHGFILAKGDRRGVVAVDRDGEVYAVARWIGVKSKQVRSKVDMNESLPSVPEALEEAASLLKDRLTQLVAEETLAQRASISEFETLRTQLMASHQKARIALEAAQAERQFAEESQRRAKQRGGLRGLIDWITGSRRKMEAENASERRSARMRDRQERFDLQDDQHRQSEVFDKAVNDTASAYETVLRELKEDVLKMESSIDHCRRYRSTDDEARPRKKTAAIRSSSVA